MKSNGTVDKDLLEWIQSFKPSSSPNVRLINGPHDYDTASLIIVDKHRSGDFTKVQDAIDAVPRNNQNLILITIKPGIYREKVAIPADKPFIILSGSGTNSTIITWNDNAKSKGTYNSATVTVFASEFIARLITFQNSYGPGVQAVALRVSGDRAAFYDCKFVGYQDTLLDENGRHYFQNCYIEGAIDFIFGNGRSLYEKCHLHAIPQLHGALTAQRRLSPAEDTGYTFLNCKVTGAGLVFLGRAWGRYSRVVFAYTYMAQIIFPQGWDDWQDPTRQKTVFYGQYKCFGPGADVKDRVPWSYELSDREAAPFLSRSFVDGQQWIRPMPSHLQRPKNLSPPRH